MEAAESVNFMWLAGLLLPWTPSLLSTVGATVSDHLLGLFGPAKWSSFAFVKNRCWVGQDSVALMSAKMPCEHAWHSC